MIGFMAGAGIVIRNSIILVDFIELRRAQGRDLAAAVVEAGAVRFDDQFVQLLIENDEPLQGAAVVSLIVRRDLSLGQ